MSVHLPSAEDLVARVLTFLASDEERLGRFLHSTGIDVGTIRQVARSPVFHEAVLDYVLEDDEARGLFAFATGIRAETVARVRAVANPPIPHETPDDNAREVGWKPRCAGPPNIARRFRVVSEEERIG